MSGLVRAAHAHGESLNGSEAALVLAAVAAALGPPLFLALRERIQGTWSKPAQAAAIVRRGAPSVLGALAAYSLGAAAVNAFEGTFVGWRAPWPGWDVLLLLLGIGGAVLPLVIPRLSRPPRPRARFG